MKKSYYPKQADIKAKWHIIDLSGKTLGRAATQITNLIRGKHKATFAPGADCGDFVVAINARDVKLTGNKWDDKTYYRYSGYMGGLKSQTAKEVLNKAPEDLIYNAVGGMLPKGPLGRKQLKKLKVYAGSEQPHAAQNPTEYKLTA